MGKDKQWYEQGFTITYPYDMGGKVLWNRCGEIPWRVALEWACAVCPDVSVGSMSAKDLWLKIANLSIKSNDRDDIEREFFNGWLNKLLLTVSEEMSVNGRVLALYHHDGKMYVLTGEPI